MRGGSADSGASQTAAEAGLTHDLLTDAAIELPDQ
jgi:hypothetical protein